MNFRNIVGIVAFIVLLASCGAPKVLVSNKDNAEKAISEGNYTQAVEAWKQYFSQTSIEETQGAIFAKAAQTAVKAGDSMLAIAWFDQARYKNYSDTEMYQSLAEIYRSQKNISKELSALEYVAENYSESAPKVNNRLFEIYNEIKLYDKALETWEKMNSDEKNDQTNLTNYFLINRSLKDTLICDSVSQIIIKKEPKNVDALDWIASKYYWKGENRYQLEMAKYNANKTTKQYKILLKELDKSTADFKKSLAYFEKLWEIEPGKKYASYFANIYARFGDEKKAKYYQNYEK
jgi:tetratricopeptide (TPR) repeat protein